MALVTVVVPTYRRPQHLTSTLASISAQTFTDIEVLVCDNAAQDDVRQLVDDLHDTRFRYVPRGQNVGLMRNALLGFRAASSPLVMKVDDDDALDPRTVEFLVAPFSVAPTTTVAFGRYELVDDDGTALTDATRDLEVLTTRAELTSGPVPCGDRAAAWGALSLACALFRKDAIDWDAIPADTDTAYDLHLALCLVADAGTAWFVPEARTRYRVHDAAETTRHPVRQSLGALAAYDVALQRGRHTHLGQIQEARDATAVMAARSLLRERELRRARDILADVLRRQRTLPALRLFVLTFAPSAVASQVSLRRAGRQQHRRR